MKNSSRLFHFLLFLTGSIVGFSGIVWPTNSCNGQVMTVAEAQEISSKTGRPILAVAGRKG